MLPFVLLTHNRLEKRLQSGLLTNKKTATGGRIPVAVDAITRQVKIKTATMQKSTVAAMDAKSETLHHEQQAHSAKEIET